jgi:nucleoside-diphosphate kinase
MIKPDAVSRSMVGKIIDIFETKGLQIAAMKMVVPSVEQVEKLYREHKEKEFFQALLNFTISGPVILIVLESEFPNTASVVKELVNSNIRYNYSISRSNRNLVHASSRYDAEYEISIFFNKDEIIDWRRSDYACLYAENERNEG